MKRCFHVVLLGGLLPTDCCECRKQQVPLSRLLMPVRAWQGDDAGEISAQQRAQHRLTRLGVRENSFQRSH